MTRSAANLAPAIACNPPHPVNLLPPRIAGWRDSPIGVPYVHRRDSGCPGPKVLLTALVHGNEYSGAVALDEWLRSGLNPHRGSITAVFCNVAAFERFDPANPDASRYVDEDFNRVWSSEALDGPGRSTELDRARALRPFVEEASHILDLHSMHEPAPPLLMTGLLSRNVAFARSLGCGYQTVLDAGHSDGSRMRDFGPFSDVQGSAIALLLEAGQHWEPDAIRVARNVLARFLIAAGSLGREHLPAGWLLPDAPSEPSPLRVTHRVVASSTSFCFMQDFRGGETLRKAGTVIAYDGNDPITTPYDDCVLVMPSLRQLRPGVTTVRLARYEAGQARKGQTPAPIRQSER